MTDSPPAEPTAETTPPPDAAKVEASPPPQRPLPPRHSGRSPVAVLGAIGFLLVFAALAYLWLQLQEVAAPPSVDPAQIAALADQVRALQQRSGQMEQRLSRLEQHPATEAAATVAPAPAPAPVDLAPLEARIAALEQRPSPAAPPAAVADGRVDALTQRLAQDEAQAKAASERMARLQLVQAAEAALRAGQALGPIANAPPALARFATTPPPTVAGLRLSFADAARRAAAASQPDFGKISLVARMWHRIESLVTVREGNKVIVGAPATAVLAEARARLDAGDLAGCLAALAALDSPAAAAMAEWRGQAQALLDARAALAALARG
jgi:hypothetical protein